MEVTVQSRGRRRSCTCEDLIAFSCSRQRRVKVPAVATRFFVFGRPCVLIDVQRQRIQLRARLLQAPTRQDIGAAMLRALGVDNGAAGAHRGWGSPPSSTGRIGAAIVGMLALEEVAVQHRTLDQRARGFLRFWYLLVLVI